MDGAEEEGDAGIGNDQHGDDPCPKDGSMDKSRIIKEIGVRGEPSSSSNHPTSMIREGEGKGRLSPREDITIGMSVGAVLNGDKDNCNDEDTKDNQEQKSWIRRIQTSKTAVIVVVGLALFTDMVMYDMIVPILPALLRRVGGNESQVGMLFAIYAAGFLIATPTFGIWSDRKQIRKLPMVVGQGGLALATILFASARSLWLLILARLLQGIAAAISWTVGLALLADTIPIEELGAAIGLVFGLNMLGFFVGPLMGGILTQAFSIETPFYCCAGLCLIDLLARILIKPPPPIQLPENGNSRQLSILSLLSYPEVWLVCLAVVVASSSFAAVETLISAYLQSSFDLDVMGVSFAMMAMIIPSVLFSFLAGLLADRYSRYTIILCALLLYVPATPLLGLATNLVLFLLASVYFGATSSLLNAPILPEMAAIVSRLGCVSYGQVYAVCNISYSLGILIGPLISSALNDRLGFLWTMCCFVIPVVLLILPFIWLVIKSRRGQLPSQKYSQEMHLSQGIAGGSAGTANEASGNVDSRTCLA